MRTRLPDSPVKKTGITSRHISYSPTVILFRLGLNPIAEKTNIF
jgi:hypothetical protein